MITDLRLILSKIFVFFVVYFIFYYSVTSFLLRDKYVYSPTPPQSPERGDFRYNNLLHYMGYPSLSGFSKNDLPKLERFFASVNLFAISSVERQWYIELLGDFQELCRQNNITFFLYYGGLLGAYRHHGFTPWDDDLDVLMPFSSKPKLEKLLKNNPVLGYGNKGKYVFPIFSMDPEKSKSIKDKKWRWPYIEVHFYEVKNEKIVHHFETCGAIKVSDIFPLIKVPFENMTMPAPRRMDCLVNNCYKYSKTRCCTQAFSHSQESNMQKGSRCVECKLLRSAFPFVFSRRRHGTYVNEHIAFNGSISMTRRVKKPLCKS